MGWIVHRLPSTGVRVTKGNNVFRDLVLARMIGPTSKIDAARVLCEVGVQAASYATLKRRLPVYAKPAWRQSLAAATARHARLGPASLVLYDVCTLYFETDAGDGFCEPGFSKERCLEPQITLGLLTDASGFPLTVAAFEDNRAETATMPPVINAFKTAYHLTDVTVVADAGMISGANQVALQAAGLSFILGRILFLADVVREWRDEHAGEAVPDQPVLTQPWPASAARKPAASWTASSTTSSAMTGPDARCAGSMSRSPKPKWRSMVMSRSSATGPATPTQK
jgi:hypothetical protein